MLIKIMKTTTITILLLVIGLFTTTSNVFASCLPVPDPVGTLSVTRTSGKVGWTIPISTSNIKYFEVSYNKDGENPSSFTLVPANNFTDDAISGNRNYSYDFTGLVQDSVYYWRLRTTCIDDSINADILSGFKTTPALIINGFLFVDGLITTGRRVEIESNFSYFTTPIFEVLTQSVGAGRLHIISVD